MKPTAWYHWSILYYLLCCPLVSGCVQGRSSTHELEHSVPPHWPANMLDAADKIQQRMDQLSSGTAVEAEQLKIELIEIISWTPEVAANTDVTEEQWNKIHQLCVQLEQPSRPTAKHKPLDRNIVDQLCGELRMLHSSLEVPVSEPPPASVEEQPAIQSAVSDVENVQQPVTSIDNQ